MCVFFFKQKTAYRIYQCDWSSDVCSSDLVEAEAALYTGDAFHHDWVSSTLDTVKSYGAEVLIGGRGKVAHGRDAVDAAIEQTREFLTRSEERRVGKECRSRWSPEHQKKKKKNLHSLFHCTNRHT